MFGPVSGAHFNPVVSAADWFLGRRPGTGQGSAHLGVLANLMFALHPVSWSHKDRSAGHLWLGAVLATAGLLLFIFALARSGRAAVPPAAVGAYIGAA